MSPPEPALERCILAAGQLQLTVLPQLGAKLASLRVLPRPDVSTPALPAEELLQAPLAPLRLRRPEDDFADSDGSGFDECLPTVAACTIHLDGASIDLPDHGEFWKLPWSITRATGTNQVELSATSQVLPLKFDKSIHLGESSIELEYSLSNLASITVPWAWSAHPLFSVEAGDRIILPPDVSAFVVEGSSGNRLGPPGATCSWPIASLPGDRAADLSIAGAITDATGDKLFTGPVQHGWCGLYRARLRLGITISFDPAEIPFLGLWLCYGGWPDRPGARQYAVAIEPCTAPVDSLASAIATGRARHLLPGQASLWKMKIAVAGLETGIGHHDFIEWCGKLK